MINLDDIYAKTNGGLDIILSYYPQARASVENGKPFCLRKERTPSAYIKQFGNVWKVTDFGDDACARSPVDVVMHEESISFKEAVFKLAGIYEIGNVLNKNTNRPGIHKRKPSGDEKEGDFNFEFNEKMTDAELKILGEKVTNEHTKILGYESVKWYSKTRKNKTSLLETTVISSNENYPIFVRVCLTDKGTEFYKLYEPFNYNKNNRFSYLGEKPKNYIHGLRELKQSFRQFNEQERKLFESAPENENKSYKEQKLESAIICSGERDALNACAYGQHPVWLNSETEKLEESNYKEICKFVKVIYNIPDIDETGRKRGIELGLRYIDIRTVKLPEWLKNYRDLRGYPRKDLRDYLELRSSKRDFNELLETAYPYKFWVWEQDGKEQRRLEISTDYMLNFLHDSGFCKLQDKETKKETFVKLEGGSIVREVTIKDVRAFLINFVRQKSTDIKVRNLVLNSSRSKTNVMDDLPVVDIDFTDNDSTRQYLFFKNKVVEVTGHGITESYLNDTNCYVWENAISEHRFKRIDSAFEITKGENIEDYVLNIKHTNSHYFRYLINTSRIYWRVEMEERASGNKDDDKTYFDKNHFSIDGQRLNYEEVSEQQSNMIAKIFAIGYMMHKYKDMSKSWAVWIMEDKISEDGASEGGTGKSFMIKFLSNFRKTLILGGRNKKLTDNPHIFENLDEQTGIILVDDADKHIDFNFFYDKITGSIEVNEKHVKTKILSYEKSGKLVFTSNHPPKDRDSSSARRLLYVVNSDWYHEKTDNNDYFETRSIKDDFGYEICRGNYKEDFWNEDINFLLDCLQFYLSTASRSIKIQPPMRKVHERINISQMGEVFMNWAEVFFSLESDNLNRELIRSDVMEAFITSTKIKTWSTQKFGKALDAFCKNTDYIEELNPCELHNSKKRIVRYIEGKTHEMIYIKTYDTKIQRLPF